MKTNHASQMNSRNVISLLLPSRTRRSRIYGPRRWPARREKYKRTETCDTCDDAVSRCRVALWVPTILWCGIHSEPSKFFPTDRRFCNLKWKSTVLYDKNVIKMKLKSLLVLYVCYWPGLEDCSSGPGIIVSRSLSRGGFVSLSSKHVGFFFAREKSSWWIFGNQQHRC